MELKELFGEESLNYDAFMEKVTANGIKLADLFEGECVSKDKYTKLQGDFDKFKTDNDISKYADYDDIKTALETLKAEKETNTLLEAITGAGVDKRYAKYVLSEVRPLVTADKDFTTCLNEYVAENEQFKTVPKSNPVTVVNSGVDLNGNNYGKLQGENALYNELDNIFNGGK